MYKYETHLHTYPVSGCAHASVRENLEFYKGLDFDGVFITNHFLDGNINIDPSRSYEEKINFYFSDFEEAKKLSGEIGIKVFCGIESSYKGTDFLIYGPDKQWYLSHPEIMDMQTSDKLSFFMESGALVIQAHPYREDWYINHIRLFPRCVHGVEVVNACRSDFENDMAKKYAESYGLLEIAGSDNHSGAKQTKLAGICTDSSISDEWDFVKRVKANEIKIFTEGR